jgi:hypothetical protein
MTGRPLDSHDDERRVAEKLGVRFEREDVGPKLIARAAAGLALMTVAVAAIAAWLLVFLRGRESAGDPQRPALFFSTGESQPEGVRLQTTPLTDLRARREEERKILTGYGWVDQTAGVVHIPIDEAMRLYLARHAGSEGAARADGPDATTRVPTDSAPVPSPIIGVTPLPPPPPSPAASGPPAPPPPHGPGPTGAHQ